MEEGIIRCVCEHMRAMNEWRDECWDDEYKKLLKCRLNHLNGKTKIRKCRRCTKLNGCEYCYVEFKIESKEIEEGATGDDSESTGEDAVEEVDSESEAQGSDLSDSEDSDWDPDDSDHEADSDLSVIYITRYLNLGSGQTETDPKWANHLTEDFHSVSYKRGSIRAAFDSVGGKSLEDLTAENEKRLLSFERPYNRQLSFKWTEEGTWERTGWDSWVLMSNEVRRFPTFKEQLLQNKEEVRFEKSLNAKTRIQQNI